jgi:hypothetical protein
MSPALRAPVTWLASYPRSGNTLLRTILKRCFGQASQSIYDDADLSDPELSALVGHETVGTDAQAFITRAAGRNLYVKTHEMPPADKHPSIYVVRDGRSAVVSHAHYVREILGRDITLTEVIEGNAGHSWSQHVRAWTPRPHTLLVRYEDLASGNAATLKNIADFIGKPQLQAFDISFEALHAISPAFSAAARIRPTSWKWTARRSACSSGCMAQSCATWAMAAGATMKPAPAPTRKVF